MRLHPSAHPFVKRLHAEMRDTRTNVHDLEEWSGVHNETVRKWFVEARNPRLSNIDAALGALGLKLTIEKVDP